MGQGSGRRPFCFLLKSLDFLLQTGGAIEGHDARDWQVLVCFLQDYSGADKVDVLEGERLGAWEAVAIVQARLEKVRKPGFPAIHCWRQRQDRPGVPCVHPGGSIASHHGSDSYIWQLLPTPSPSSSSTSSSSLSLFLLLSLSRFFSWSNIPCLLPLDQASLTGENAKIKQKSKPEL